MFASSQTDKSKAKAVSDSVKSAIENGAQTPSPKASKPVEEPEKEGNPSMEKVKKSSMEKPATPSMEEVMKQLNIDLKEEIRTGKVALHVEPRGLVVSLRQGAFFPSGGDTITPDSFLSLDKLAATIKKVDGDIQLEGHTDSIPIHNDRFKSNWELSAARSIAVLELFCNRNELPRKRFGISGYAETQPADSNDTDTGRAHNRRVDVVILNPGAEKSKPPATASVAGEQPARPEPAKKSGRGI
jgi:chemotaxis protein MotB